MTRRPLPQRRASKTFTVDDAGYPVMLCEPVRRCSGGVLQWRFWCSHCHDFHHHGAAGGHRSAHCTRPNSPYARGGYVLRLDPKFHERDTECQRSKRKESLT